MEYHTEHPACQPEISKEYVELPKVVSFRDMCANQTQAVGVGEEIKKREEDGEGLLHAEEAIERPFSVVLDDGVEVGWIAGESGGGGYVLAGVVAFRGAGPEEEPVVEG